MGSARFTSKHWLACAATWVAACAWGQEAKIWNVCLPDYAVPPYLTLPGKSDGTVQRLIFDSARHAGLTLSIQRFPPARCFAMLERGEVQATIAGATLHNLGTLGFPLEGNAPDASKRLVRLRLIWIKSRQSQWDWTGSSFIQTQSRPLVMGTLLRNQVARDALELLKVKVDAAAYSTSQLLSKVAAGRVDGVTMFEEEFELLRNRPEAAAVEVLPRPFVAADYYLVSRRDPTPSEKATLEAWWSAIATLRPLPAYQIR
jgi:hypothetical protein